MSSKYNLMNEKVPIMSPWNLPNKIQLLFKFQVNVREEGKIIWEEGWKFIRDPWQANTFIPNEITESLDNTVTIHVDHKANNPNDPRITKMTWIFLWWLENP